MIQRLFSGGALPQAGNRLWGRNQPVSPTGILHGSDIVKCAH